MVQGKDRELFPLVNPVSQKNMKLSKDQEYFGVNMEKNPANQVTSPVFGKMLATPV